MKLQHSYLIRLIIDRPYETRPRRAKRQWQETPFANLIRYVPSRTYLPRIRMQGKLIVKPVKTNSIAAVEPIEDEVLTLSSLTMLASVLSNPKMR